MDMKRVRGPARRGGFVATPVSPTLRLLRRALIH